MIDNKELRTKYQEQNQKPKTKDRVPKEKPEPLRLEDAMVRVSESPSVIELLTDEHLILSVGGVYGLWRRR